MRYFAQGVHQNILLRPIKIFRQEAVFGGVIAECVQKRMRHIRLEAKGLRPVHPLQQLAHSLPALHSTPADLSLSGEALAIVFGDGGGLGKCRRDSPCIASWIFGPRRRRRRGVDAYYAITANTKLAQLFADLTGLLYLVKKTC